MNLINKIIIQYHQNYAKISPQTIFTRNMRLDDPIIIKNTRRTSEHWITPYSHNWLTVILQQCRRSGQCKVNCFRHGWCHDEPHLLFIFLCFSCVLRRFNSSFRHGMAFDSFLQVWMLFDSRVDDAEKDVIQRKSCRGIQQSSYKIENRKIYGGGRERMKLIEAQVLLRPRHCCTSMCSK